MNLSNTNFGKQDDVIKDVHGDAIKNVHGDVIKNVPGDVINGAPSNSVKVVVINVDQGRGVGGVASNVDRGDSANVDRGDSANVDRGDSDVNKVNKVASGYDGLPCVLIVGVSIAGVLIAVVLIVGLIAVFIPKHKKLSNDGKVDVDASLSATGGDDSSWPSPSGDFAFGFQPLENSDLFLLCIWFAKIPDKTIVWYANGDRPAPKGSTVKLTANSGLVLTSPQDEQLWKSDQTIAGVVAHGVMNDTGNFVLENDKSESLWETFKNPTDTMLPGQIIERGGKLSSRQSETNYTRGRFQLDFQQDGNLVFNQLDFQQDGNLVYSVKKPFCSTKTTNGKVPDSEGKQLVFDDSGNFYILRVNGWKFNFTAEECPASDNYLRSTLNFDGVLAQYFLPKSFVGKATWKALWSEPKKVDPGAGDCGDKCSNCYLNADHGRTCEC